MRQQLVDAVGWMGGAPLQHVLEVRVGVAPVDARRVQQAGRISTCYASLATIRMAYARSLPAKLIVHPSSEDRADGGGAPPPRPWTGPRPQDAGAPVDGPSGSDLTTASPHPDEEREEQRIAYDATASVPSQQRSCVYKN